MYAIVPKNNSSLEEIIKKRAEQIANERVASVAHSMALEAQIVDVDVLKNQKDELVKNLMENLSKQLWSSQENYHKNSQENRLKKNIEKKNCL